MKEGLQAADADGLDNSFDGWTGDSLKTCKDLVYMMTLNNQTEEKIKFKIKLN